MSQLAEGLPAASLLCSAGDVSAQLLLLVWKRQCMQHVWGRTLCLTLICLRRGTGGDQDPKRWGKREIIYLTLHCHHQNESCITEGRQHWESFNVLLIGRSKVTKTMSISHNLWRRKTSKVESNWGPSVYWPNALPLGQTSSLVLSFVVCC